MSAPQPLAGLKVVEFTHMVMGPAAGAILAGLGAEVTRVEPVEGDKTRTLLGSGAGYFPLYNRHKKSVSLDLKSEEGLATAKALAAEADRRVGSARRARCRGRARLLAVAGEARQGDPARSCQRPS